MQRARFSPLDFRQEVRSHPGMLLVTAKNKQRHTKTLQVSWNGQLPAITAFDVTKHALQSSKKNTQLVSTLIETLGRGYDKKAHPQHQIYQGVEANLVKALIEKFSYSEGGGNWEKTTLQKYISDMRQISELTDWTVVLFSRKGKESASPVIIGEHNVFPLQRQVDVLDQEKSEISKIGLKNSALVSLSDEFLDFSKEERLRVEKTGRDKKTGEAKTVREDIRVSRPNSRALLLIYFIDLYHATDVVEHKRISLPTLSISFPQSPNGKSIQVTTGLLEGLEDADFEEIDDE